jgi:hypothetical protein
MWLLARRLVYIYRMTMDVLARTYRVKVSPAIVQTEPETAPF